MGEQIYKKKTAEGYGDQLPREKVRDRGVASLSDRELMALILGTGRQGKDVMEMAGELIRFLEQRDYRVSGEDLARIKGIGEARGSQLLGVMEFSRRLTEGKGVRITCPETVQKILYNYGDRDREYFFSITLNGAHEMISKHIVSTGNLNRVYIQATDVFRTAIRENSAALIVAHNHPSGALEPSDEDRKITEKLQEVARLLNIPLLDHIIFSRRGFFSFLENGILT